MMDFGSVAASLLPTAIEACIYALLCLGLNVQWGCAGLGNLGIAGFYALGAYTSALLTTPQTPQHLGGFALPIPLGMLGAMLVAGVVAYSLGKLTLHRHADALAIVSLGMAETVHLVLQNANWLTNGVQGICDIPRPLAHVFRRSDEVVYLGLILGSVVVVYSACEGLRRSPWGRVLKAIRHDEAAAASVGKDVGHFKLQGLVVGAVIMGFGGSMYAHYGSCIRPDTFDPLMGTLLVWTMLLVGGSGHNRRAIVGALSIWGLWSLSEVVSGLLPLPLQTMAPALRVILIIVLMQVMLVRCPQGVR